jgi:hypothetical protein
MMHTWERARLQPTKRCFAPDLQFGDDSSAHLFTTANKGELLCLRHETHPQAVVEMQISLMSREKHPRPQSTSNKQCTKKAHILSTRDYRVLHTRLQQQFTVDLTSRSAKIPSVVTSTSTYLDRGFALLSTPPPLDSPGYSGPKHNDQNVNPLLQHCGYK